MRKKIFLFLLTVVLAGMIFSGCGRQANVWYVQSGFEKDWAAVLETASPPEAFGEVRVWDNASLPDGPGVLISSAPWETREKVSVYYRLSRELEHEGARVLALDPWMIFRKHRNPPLTAGRVYSGTEGEGLLLVPGKDPRAVQAWTARLVQEQPGVFPSGETWREAEQNLFKGNRFLSGAQTYNWNDVLFRLMGSEPAWVYAPLSAIRRFENSQKAILEAAAFPEKPENTQYSLQARLLWALPLGTEKERKNLAPTLEWLKKPETQTVIANAIGWIPADPYGKPFDPVSLNSHRNWLTAVYVYEVND